MESATVLQVSQSKKTFSLNYGIQDGIAKGDVARLYKRPVRGSGTQGVFMGVAKAMKVLGSYSLWYFQGPPEGNLEKGNLVVLFIFEDYAQTKEKLDLHRKMVVVTSQSAYKLSEVKDEEGRDQPQSLVQYEEEFARDNYVESTARAGGARKGPDLVDLGEWRPPQVREPAPGDQGELVLKELFKAPGEEETEKRILEKNYLDEIAVHFEKEGDPQFDLINFYKDQEREEGLDEFGKTINTPNTMHEMEERKKHRQKEYLKTMENLSKEGPAWSDDMSDDNLRRFVEKKGLNLEEVRQEKAINTKISDEIFFQYSLGLKNHKKETEEATPPPYYIALGYEFYGIKISEDYRYLSLEGNIRWGQDVYDLGDRNGFSKEIGFLLGMNYYPFHLPSQIKTVLYFMGIGARKGTSEIRGGTNYENLLGYYNMFSFPSFSTGLKYRLDNKFGLNMEISMDRLNIDAVENQVRRGAPTSLKINDFKLSVGLNSFF